MNLFPGIINCTMNLFPRMRTWQSTQNKHSSCWYIKLHISTNVWLGLKGSKLKGFIPTADFPVS